MRWIDRLASIEELEDARFDSTLVQEMQRRASTAAAREIRFSTPTFKSYSNCELEGCGKNSFPPGSGVRFLGQPPVSVGRLILEENWRS